VIVTAITGAGRTPGRDGMAVAWTPPSANSAGTTRSIADSLGEDDTSGRPELTTAVGVRVRLVGDSFVTDPCPVSPAGHRWTRLPRAVYGRRAP
jgi:hypothetical protein